MSDESKKIERIEKEAKQDVKEVKSAELSEHDLENVAGGKATTNVPPVKLPIGGGGGTGPYNPIPPPEI